MAYRDVPIEQELLAHQAFLKRLATDLVGADAEDLVQDVWQRALERPPQSHRLRGWLARVARNLSANRWRDEARRREREQRRAEPSPTQAELETHLEMRKELVAALDALCPTHRETILLRYFEGLAPRDIAERQAAPVSTVKTRLQRGLAQLRTTLDERRGGERNAWVPAVTALGVTARSQPASGALGGIVMGMKMKLGAAALVVGVAAYFAPRPQSTEPLPVSTVEPAVNEEGDETALDETRPANEVASSGERQAVAEELENRAATRDAAQVLRVVVGGPFGGRRTPGDGHREGARRAREVERSDPRVLAASGPNERVRADTVPRASRGSRRPPARRPAGPWTSMLRATSANRCTSRYRRVNVKAPATSTRPGCGSSPRRSGRSSRSQSATRTRASISIKSSCAASPPR